MSRNEQVVEPTFAFAYNIQYSVHKIGARSLRDEIFRIFPDAKPPKLEQNSRELFIIPTFQKTECDLLAFGEEPEREKDRLLRNVLLSKKLN